MPRRSIIQIPPALPAQLTPPKEKPSAFIDHVHTLTMMAYAEEEARGDRFRAFMNTVDTEDAQTGVYKGDMLFAAVILKDIAREKGIFPDVVAAKENDIAKKFQFALRRHDTEEVAFSRSRRLLALAPPATDLDATGAE